MKIQIIHISNISILVRSSYCTDLIGSVVQRHSPAFIVSQKLRDSNSESIIFNLRIHNIAVLKNNKDVIEAAYRWYYHMNEEV